MKTSILLTLLIVAVLLGFAPASHALTPHGRHHTGIIQQVTAETRHAVLLPADNSKPITFLWNKHTEFVAGSGFVEASSMTKGSRVEIILHRPFFGEPFVTKVILLSRSSNNQQRKR